MKHKGIKQVVSMLLAVVMLLSLMPVTAMARTITPVETGGGINLRTDGTGKLLWDPVTGATGYRIDVCVHPGNSVLMTESVGADTTSYALYAELDDRTFDNGDYRVELHVSGANAEYSSSTLILCRKKLQTSPLPYLSPLQAEHRIQTKSCWAPRLSVSAAQNGTHSKKTWDIFRLVSLQLVILIL